MRYAIPVLDDRVAPRSTCATGVLILTLSGGHIVYREMVTRDINNPIDLIVVLKDFQVDTLVCGGNNLETKELLLPLEVSVVDNVACSVATTIAALEKGTLHPGYGLLSRSNSSRTQAGVFPINPPLLNKSAEPCLDVLPDAFAVDCLDCEERVCLKGEICQFSSRRPTRVKSDIDQMLESAADISMETERALCRVAELVYFFLEMNYKSVGIAFCEELLDQTRVLAGVLRRFFDVFAVCCKVGDIGPDKQSARSDFDALGSTCNPLGQAEILGRFGSQINVIVGLCIGADCVFTKASKVPVTTLFVKDRMLANNPIGAVYSDHYLAEIARHKSNL
ncbi:MAG: DUF1847 domain-containing protein [bacterium]